MESYARNFGASDMQVDSAQDANVKLATVLVEAHACSAAVDGTRRPKKTTDHGLQGLRCLLPSHFGQFSQAQRTELDSLVAQETGDSTACAWVFHEQLR